MNLRTLAVLLIAIAPVHDSWAERADMAVASLQFSDPAGRKVEPLRNHGQKATLLFFLTPDCPLCNTYAPEIARIVGEYEKQGVQSYAIYADEPAGEISRHLREYKLPLTALLDPRLQLATLTGATITPEACLLSPDGQLLYRGRIDDRAVKLGTVRTEPRQRDLRLALDAVLANKKVAEKFTKAIGCYLPTPQKPK